MGGQRWPPHRIVDYRWLGAAAVGVGAAMPDPTTTGYLAHAVSPSSTAISDSASSVDFIGVPSSGWLRWEAWGCTGGASPKSAANRDISTCRDSPSRRVDRICQPLDCRQPRVT